jgi:hypothetical protein
VVLGAESVSSVPADSGTKETREAATAAFKVAQWLGAALVHRPGKANKRSPITRSMVSRCFSRTRRRYGVEPDQLDLPVKIAAVAGIHRTGNMETKIKRAVSGQAGPCLTVRPNIRLTAHRSWIVAATSKPERK